MYSSLKLFFPRLSSFVSRPTRVIDLEPLPTHNVETDPERRARTLKHLLKANHANHAIFHHNLEEANSVPNVLCAAYLLGQTAEDLATLCEELSQGLDPWPEIVGGVEDDVWRATEIGQDEWKEFLGKRNQQRAFIDFYEDRMVAEGYEWKQLINHYLYEGEVPLAYSLAAGSGVALVHLATAYRFNFRDLGIEALAMASCLYSAPLASTAIAPQHAGASGKTSSILLILAEFSRDARFKKHTPNSDSSQPQSFETVVVDCLNRWTHASNLEDSQYSSEIVRDALKEVQVVAVILALACAKGTDPTKTKTASSMVTSNILTPLIFSDALRTILPHAPAGFAIPLLRQCLRLMILSYVVNETTDISDTTVHNSFESLGGGAMSWKSVTHQLQSSDRAVGHRGAVQAVLALQTAAETWGDDVELSAVAGLNQLSDQANNDDEMRQTYGQNFWLKAASVLTSNMAQS